MPVPVGRPVLTAIGHPTNEATAPRFADEVLDQPFEFADLERTMALVLGAPRG